MRLTAMSQSRKDAVRKLENLSFQLVTHLIKVGVNPTHQAADHWCYEIRAWLLTAYAASFVKGGKRLTSTAVEDYLIDHTLTEVMVFNSLHDLAREGLLPPQFQTLRDFQDLATEILTKIKPSCDLAVSIVCTAKGEMPVLSTIVTPQRLGFHI